MKSRVVVEILEGSLGDMVVKWGAVESQGEQKHPLRNSGSDNDGILVYKGR